MYRGLSFAKMKNKLNRKFGGLLSPSSKLNTQYLTNLTIVCPAKWISGLKMTMKWFRKYILEIPPCARHVIFSTEFVLLIKIQ